jgi:isoleucyl-tRNA synthetase
VVDLSALYMAVLKDRLYTFPRSSRERKSAQTAMWRIAEALTRLAAPIMTFTADEVWRFLPVLKSRPESAHMALFPNDHDVTGEIRDRDAAATLREDWEKLVTIRDEVNKAIEQSRNEKVIDSDQLTAAIVITAPAESYKLLERYRGHLNALFVVSAVELKLGNAAGEALAVEVRRAPGQKC